MAHEPVTPRKRLTWYTTVIIILTMGAGLFVNIGYITVVDHRRKTADRAALRAVVEAQNSAAHKALVAQCQLVKAVLRAYAENPPPVTKTGVDIKQAWVFINEQFGCDHL